MHNHALMGMPSYEDLSLNRDVGNVVTRRMAAGEARFRASTAPAVRGTTLVNLRSVHSDKEIRQRIDRLRLSPDGSAVIVQVGRRDPVPSQAALLREHLTRLVFYIHADDPRTWDRWMTELCSEGEW